jgi:hypothetical protein
MIERRLSLLAYRTRREIQQILASTSPHEVFDRVEDILHGRFVDLETAIRRDVRRDKAADE